MEKAGPSVKCSSGLEGKSEWKDSTKQRIDEEGRLHNNADTLTPEKGERERSSRWGGKDSKEYGKGERGQLAESGLDKKKSKE